MERTDRYRRLTRLKLWSAVGALAALGAFSGLAAANTRQNPRRIATPIQQLNVVESQTGYSFFASSKVTPPTYSSSAPQVSSGGS